MHCNIHNHDHTTMNYKDIFVMLKMRLNKNIKLSYIHMCNNKVYKF